MAGFTPDLETLLAGTFGQLGGSSLDDGTRVPVLFTSRLRLIAAGQDRLEIGPELANQLAPLRGPVFRPVIAMAINPKSVQFRQPKRKTKKDVVDGSAFMHFTNRKGQNNDILTLQFECNTGNLDLRGSLGLTTPPSSSGEQQDSARNAPKVVDTGALEKLIIFHNLYQISREPMRLGDGTQNEISISFSSQLFPITLQFVGHFDNVIDFTESAQKPNSRDFSFGFTVERTNPDLDELVGLLGDLLATPPGAADIGTIQNGDVSARPIGQEVLGGGIIPGRGSFEGPA